MKQLIVRVKTPEGQTTKIADVDLGSENKELRGHANPAVTRVMSGYSIHLFMLSDTLHNRSKLLQKSGYIVFIEENGAYVQLERKWLESLFGDLAGREVDETPIQPRSQPIRARVIDTNIAGGAISMTPDDGQGGDPQAGSDRQEGDIPQAAADKMNEDAENSVTISSLKGFLAKDFKTQMKILEGPVPVAFLEELVGYGGIDMKSEVQERAFAKLGA